jgi:hypothetical protein
MVSVAVRGSYLTFLLLNSTVIANQKEYEYLSWNVLATGCSRFFHTMY